MDPFFFYTGFSDRWYEKFLVENEFEIELRLLFALAGVLSGWKLKLELKLKLKFLPRISSYLGYPPRLAALRRRVPLEGVGEVAGPREVLPLVRRRAGRPTRRWGRRGTRHLGVRLGLGLRARAHHLLEPNGVFLLLAIPQ